MKDSYKFLGICLFIICISILIASVIIIGMTGTIETDNTIRAEGEVVDMKQDQSGHWLGGYDYFVQLNSSIKWYEISETNYWKIEIGNYIVIYKSQRVEIIN